MTEELKEQAQDALGVLLQDMLSAKEFVVDQAPDVVQQLLTIGMWDATMSVSIGVVLAIVAWRTWITLWASENEETKPLGPIFGCIVGFVATLFIFGGSYYALKIKVAPKVYIIEYVMDLVNDGDSE